MYITRENQDIVAFCSCYDTIVCITISGMRTQLKKIFRNNDFSVKFITAQDICSIQKYSSDAENVGVIVACEDWLINHVYEHVKEQFGNNLFFVSEEFKNQFFPQVLGEVAALEREGKYGLAAALLKRHVLIYGNEIGHYSRLLASKHGKSGKKYQITYLLWESVLDFRLFNVVYKKLKEKYLK